MKVLSFNVRGLRKKMKRSEIRRMINLNDIDICCLQETKTEHMENKVGNELWPNKEFDWTWKEADGRAGGLISIWNKNVFSKTSSWYSRDLLVVNGRWREDGGEMVIINVYAPCVTTENEQLWDTIKLVIEQNKEARICVVGYFNSIRTSDERIGNGGEVSRRDIRVFDDFILTSVMIDLPLQG
ncbi:hypothetical protein ACS0TY_017524 [Phlomoides rotata]